MMGKNIDLSHWLRFKAKTKIHKLHPWADYLTCLRVFPHFLSGVWGNRNNCESPRANATVRNERKCYSLGETATE